MSAADGTLANQRQPGRKTIFSCYLIVVDKPKLPRREAGSAVRPGNVGLVEVFRNDRPEINPKKGGRNVRRIQKVRNARQRDGSGGRRGDWRCVYRHRQFPSQGYLQPVVGFSFGRDRFLEFLSSAQRHTS